MGWHEDAYSKFDSLCRRIQAQRLTAQSQTLEEKFQQKATMEYATLRGGDRAKAKRQEPSMVVFNELVTGNSVAL
jgi:hypothetical protein